MRFEHSRQHGASTIGTIILLAILGIGGYIGFQYVPQYMESGKVDSILASIEKAYDEKPVDSVKQVRGMISKRLQINTMKPMESAFEVTDTGDSFVIKVAYERELNLLYEKKAMPYEKRLELKK